MKIKIFLVLRILLVVGGLAVVSGCSTTSEHPGKPEKLPIHILH